MADRLRVVVWNEFRGEREREAIRKVYPQGIHETIARALRTQDDFDVHTATLDEPEHGLTQDVVDTADVVLWWGHSQHDAVSDRVVDRLQKAVLDGMGLIALHSSHLSKIFTRLMGTSAMLNWREVGERERLWVIDPGHPIVEGLGETIELEHEEMYGEYFDVPDPEELVFISWFPGGEVFRSGLCYHRGKGRIFYFRPGHETYPTYEHPDVVRVLINAVRWATPVDGPTVTFGNAPPREG